MPSPVPKVECQESEEEELVDPQQTLREKCLENSHCASFNEKYLACNDRVNSRTKTTETCTEELFDFLHCIDHCVTEKLFSFLNMRYVAAYLLASLGGKENPSSADIEKILSSVGIEADGEKLKKVIGELNGKNLETLIAAGREKLSSMPVGGAVAAAPAAAGAPAAAAAPEKEDKKPEKKEESESEDDDMGFGLFD